MGGYSAHLDHTSCGIQPGVNQLKLNEVLLVSNAAANWVHMSSCEEVLEHRVDYGAVTCN